MQKVYKSQIEITTRIHIIHHLLDELYGCVEIDDGSQTVIAKIEKQLNELDVIEGVPERKQWYLESDDRH